LRPSKTASGLYIPTKDNETLPEGTVVAVGPGAPNKDGQIIPVNVKEGDRVLLPQFGGQPVKIGEDEYTIFRDADLLAKLNE
jgi:chaperonin GroES